jgi:hypothetical protein
LDQADVRGGSDAAQDLEKSCASERLEVLECRLEWRVGHAQRRRPVCTPPAAGERSHGEPNALPRAMLRHDHPAARAGDRDPAGGRGGDVNQARPVLALARVEGARLLRHPLVVLASALLVAQWVVEQVGGDPAGAYPALQRADADTQTVLLTLAGAALVAANLAVLRARRHGAEPLFGTLAMPAWQRTAGHLLSLVIVGLLGALLAGAHIAYLATLPGAAGRPNPLELATGPVLVVLGGALGVLLARLVRSALAGPLAVLLLAWLLFGVDSVGYGAGEAARYMWFSVYVPQTWSWWAPVPADLLGRPAGWHLAYLAGIVLLVAVAALARSGGPAGGSPGSRRRCWRSPRSPGRRSCAARRAWRPAGRPPSSGPDRSRSAGSGAR